jgi:hypothetical protein
MATTSFQAALTPTSTNAGTYTTATFTPTAGLLLVCTVATVGDNSVLGTETLTSSTGLTFTKAGEVQLAASVRRASVWVSTGPSTNIGQTITYFTNGSFTGAAMNVFTVSGMGGKYGSAVIKQIGSVLAATNQTATITLPGTADTNNPWVASWTGDNGGASYAFTPDWSHFNPGTHTSPTSRYQASTKNSGISTSTISLPTYNAARIVIVVELDSTSAGETIPVPTITQVQTEFNPNVNELQFIPKLGQIFSLLAVTVSVGEKVPVTKLTELQTLQIPILNAKEAIAVPKLTEIQTLIVPSIVAAGGSTTTAYLSPTQATGDGATPDFAGVTNLYTSNDTYATITLGASVESEGVFAWAFSGLSVPTDATIQGIQVEVEGAVTAGSLTNLSMKLANANSYTPLSVDTKTCNFTGSDAYQVMGGPADLWGEVDTDGGAVKDRAWTPADLNTSDFCVFFRATATSSGATVRLDHIRLKVTYSTGVVVDTVLVPKLTQTQTLQVPILNAKEAIAVPRLVQIQTLQVPITNFKEAIAVPRLVQIQTLQPVSVNEIQVIPTLVAIQTMFDANVVENEVQPMPILAQIQSLYAPNIVGAPDVVPIPLLARTQTLFDPIVNAREVVAVPRLAQLQALYAPNLAGAADIVFVPRLIETQTLQVPIVNARDVVVVPKLAEIQTLLAVNVNENQLAPTLAEVQTLFAPGINARDVVVVPRLAQIQSLLVPAVNAREIVSIPKLTEAQSLFAPAANSKEVVAVPKLAQLQTFYGLQINETIGFATKAFTQTLLLPGVRELQFIPKLDETQTLYPPAVLEANQVAADTLVITQTFLAANVRDLVPIPKLVETQTFNSVKVIETIGILTLAETQSLFAPTTNAREVIAIPKLAETQTFNSVKVIETVGVDRLAEVQTLFAPAVNARDVVAVPKLAETQSLYAPSVNVSSGITIPILANIQVLYAPGVNAREGLAVAVQVFVETLYAPNINVREKIVVPKLTETQTFLDAGLNISAAVQVTTRTFVQTLHVPRTIEPVFVSTHQFIQSLYAPSLMAIEVIEIVVAGDAEIQVTVLAERQIDVAVVSNPLKEVVV